MHRATQPGQSGRIAVHKAVLAGKPDQKDHMGVASMGSYCTKSVLVAVSVVAAGATLAGPREWLLMVSSHHQLLVTSTPTQMLSTTAELSDGRAIMLSGQTALSKVTGPACSQSQ